MPLALTQGPQTCRAASGSFSRRGGRRQRQHKGLPRPVASAQGIIFAGVPRARAATSVWRARSAVTSALRSLGSAERHAFIQQMRGGGSMNGEARQALRQFEHGGEGGAEGEGGPRQALRRMEGEGAGAEKGWLESGGAEKGQLLKESIGEGEGGGTAEGEGEGRPVSESIGEAAAQLDIREEAEVAATSQRDHGENTARLHAWRSKLAASFATCMQGR